MADRELDPSDRPAKRQRVSDDDAATTSNPGAACLSQTLSLVSDEAARRDLDDQLAKEIRVGVDQFTSPEASGFVGVLKQRYHDFMVNEIALDGKVWHLDEDAGFLASERKAAEAAAAEEEAKAKEEKKAEAEQVQEEAKPAEEPAPGPEEESKANSGEIAEADVNRLKAIFGDTADAIIALDRDVVSKPKLKARDFDTVSSQPIARAERSAAHQAVREIFNHRLNTETEQGGIIKVVAGNPKVRRGHAPPPNSKGMSVGRRGNKQNQAYKVNWLEVGGEQLHFTLYKENKDTMEIINFLCKALRVDDRKFGYAGTKDRRAVTVQRISATRISAAQMADLAATLFNCRIGNFEYKPRALSLGDLMGNEFTITLRDCHFPEEEGKSIEERAENARGRLQKAVDHFERHGFINYFGLQRFGTFAVSTDTIGKHMLKGDLGTAIDLIMSYSQEAVEAYDKEEESLISDDDRRRAKALHIWKTEQNAHRALEIMPARFVAEKRFISWLGQKDQRTKQLKHPTDWQGAMYQLPRNLRLMYPHAYQSLVWNTMASERIKRHGLRVIPGDLVLVHEHKDKEPNHGAAAAPEDLEEFDADGEPIIRPAGDNAAADPFERARPLTSAEVESGLYSVFDVVLPTPGYDVEYPANDIGAYYKEYMLDEQRGGGINPLDMRRKWRDISLPGAYRKLLGRVLPGGVGFDVKTYREGASATDQLVPTDLDRLIEQGKGISLEEARKRNWVDKNDRYAKTPLPGMQPPKPAEATEALAEDRLAVVLKFKLGSSMYATVALRELMKGGAQAFRPEFTR
ncbi:pseudouridine synthase-like protein TruD/Pus7 [Phyllosticta capitalensis]|uniref:Pseudouridine synthase-like protein TruD/Pus7 n=1 Tax=Phyllosticta capitalensis TaxID=121624 RepID=A0ABR1YP34_9PEZI